MWALLKKEINTFLMEALHSKTAYLLLKIKSYKYLNTSGIVQLHLHGKQPYYDEKQIDFIIVEYFTCLRNVRM